MNTSFEQIIEELDKYRNKNKVIKDALGLYFVLRDEVGSDNPLKILKKVAYSNSSKTHEPIKGGEGTSAVEIEDVNVDYIDLEINELVGILNAIKQRI